MSEMTDEAMLPLRYTTEYVGDILVVHIGAKHALLRDGADDFRKALLILTEEQKGNPILIDLSKVESIDSTMIQALVIAQSKAREGSTEADHAFGLVGLSMAMQRDFITLQVDTAFSIYPSTLDAVVAITAEVPYQTEA